MTDSFVNFCSADLRLECHMENTHKFYILRGFVKILKTQVMNSKRDIFGVSTPDETTYEMTKYRNASHTCTYILIITGGDRNRLQLAGEVMYK